MRSFVRKNTMKEQGQTPCLSNYPSDDWTGILSETPVARIPPFPSALAQMLFTSFHISQHTKVRGTWLPSSFRPNFLPGCSLLVHYLVNSALWEAVEWVANSLLVTYLTFIDDVSISGKKTSSSYFHIAGDHTRWTPGLKVYSWLVKANLRPPSSEESISPSASRNRSQEKEKHQELQQCKHEMPKKLLK